MMTVRKILLLALLLALASGLAAVQGGAEAAGNVGPGIEAEVTRQLMEASPWKDAVVDVRDVRLGGYTSGAGDFDKVVVELPYGMGTRGKVSYSVTLLKGSKEVERFWGGARVEVFEEAVVALVPLRRDREITTEDVKVELVELRDAERAVKRVEEVVGMTAKRPINPGSVVKRNYLRPRRLITRGETVTVRIESDRLKIRSKATATEHGYHGGTVTVRTGSGKELQGRVTGPGELLVRF